jgi:hypothetical protein
MLLTIPSFTQNELNAYQNLLHWWEFILTPIYFVIIIKIGRWYYDKKNTAAAGRNLFLNGLRVKMIGAIIITLLYNLYYRGGDTTGFFNDGKLLNKILYQDPAAAGKMYMISGNVGSWPSELSGVESSLRMTGRASNWLVVKVSSIFSLISFDSMLCTALFFAFIAYLCIWKFYTALSEMYPPVKKKLAIALFFVPCIVIWGSDISKDTISISALLILFCMLREIFFKKKVTLKNILISAGAIFLLGTIKSYILYAFALSALLWLLIGLGYSFRKLYLRIFYFIFTGALAAALAYLSLNFVNQQLQASVVDALLEKTVDAGEYLQKTSNKREGSTYDIGKPDPTITGFLIIAPKAINVTLFRPYPWESGKVIILFAALESTIIFFYFIFVLLKNKIIFFFIKIARDPFLILCIVFTAIIATFVGISSDNFGTLVRYKIPCMPFFLAALVIISHNKKKEPRIAKSSA